MRYLSSLALAIFIGLVSTSARAHFSTLDRGGNWYGALSVGVLAFTYTERIADGLGSCAACRNVKVSPDIGYDVMGSFGRWMSALQRAEIAIGYRSYDLELEVSPNNKNDEIRIIHGAAHVIPVLLSNYFYPIAAFPSVPQAHQPYFGLGAGAGFWSFEADASLVRFDDSYENVSFMIIVEIGYDFYLSGLKDTRMFKAVAVESIALGVNYRFSWAPPKPYSFTPFGHSLNQNSHIISTSLRLEF